MKIIAIREYPELLEPAVDYFSSRWGVDRNIYQDCIANSLTTESPLPRWYLMMNGNRIIGSYGLVVNDFISRQDIWSWICAVYIEEDERGKELGSRLLEHSRKEAAKLGFPTIYLSTDHVGFYEKYGWQYIGQGYSIGGKDTRIYKAGSTYKETQFSIHNEMKTIRIDYYTGTGGSELVARLLAEKLRAQNIDIEINRIFRDSINKVDELSVDYYVLIFPVHSFNAPKPIYEWVENLVGNGCKTAILSVSGGGNVITNSACRCKTVKLLKNSNFSVVYEDMVRMPNNWVKAPKEKKYTRILSKLPGKIDEISQTIVSEKRKKKVVYWIDYLISVLGEAEKKETRRFGEGIKVLDSCIGCGLCSKNCCSSNIKMESQTSLEGEQQLKPKFGNRCDMCLGCIYNCPQKALQPTWGSSQIDKNGYDLRLMYKNSTST